MRVTLVNPPSAFLLDDKVFPPLGVLRVAACLEREGHDVTVLDLAGKSPDVAVEADLIGVTATTAQMPSVMRMTLVGRTVLGGAHATMMAAAAKRGSERGRRRLAELLGCFDAVVAGDGEEAIFEAMTRDGLIDADDPKSSLYVMDQDRLPAPARHLLDFDSYEYRIDGKRATSVVTQLGCPFGCAFCGGRYSPFYRRVRFRSVEHILSEVASLHGRYGLEGFMFLDDELNVSPLMPVLMRRLTELQRERGAEFAMRGFVKASLFTDEQADALREAGFREVLFGFESGDDRILRNMQKGSVANNTKALRIAAGAGLRVKALMSLGHPGESAGSVKATRDWLLAEKPADFDVTIITPYPGTPYWDDAREDTGVWTYSAKTGDRLHMFDTDYGRDSSYYKGVPGEYRAHVWTDHLTADDLVEIRDETERSVRTALSISWPKAQHFDHSMGQA
jgi:radical SAM superfamily enzyme YgiQ (UPF0313 family)